jgi:hypothetical protein
MVTPADYAADPVRGAIAVGLNFSQRTFLRLHLRSLKGARRNLLNILSYCEIAERTYNGKCGERGAPIFSTLEFSRTIEDVAADVRLTLFRRL